MKAKPLTDCILVRQTPEPMLTAGMGIFIPETARLKPRQGTVVAVGAGRINARGIRFESEVKSGDEILFIVDGGTEVELDRQRFLVVREQNILGIVE
jgi:chaperonin GroES